MGLNPFDFADTFEAAGQARHGFFARMRGCTDWGRAHLWRVCVAL